MAIEKISISIPAEVLNDIDRLAERWFTNRSQAMLRIVMEWKRSQAEAEKNLEPVADIIEEPVR